MRGIYNKSISQRPRDNNPNNPDTPITAAVLTAEFGKFEKKMEHLLSEQTKATEQLLADQATVILDAVEERMHKKLDEKFDSVITKLDAVLKEFEDHRDEDIAGAEQLRRHDDQLKKHETRIGKLEIAATRA